jgi:hypothetical protein
MSAHKKPKKKLALKKQSLRRGALDEREVDRIAGGTGSAPADHKAPSLSTNLG